MRKFKNLNWTIIFMAIGILVSLFLHYSSQKNEINKEKINIENERNNIRTMFAYEISHNQSNLNFLDGTKKVGFNQEKCQTENCVPSAVELNAFADIRLKVINSLRDDVYTIYLPKIYLLEPKEVSLIMNYYYNQKNLLKNSRDIHLELAKNRNNKKWLEEKTYVLNQNFEDEYSLGKEILKMYQSHIPKEKLVAP
ncbi:hypothetical protein GKR72_09535 [Providencia stuartii]|uniref:Uncharacterized protein n=1 Tax=Providencia stuartii ATCC 25827 TaxID=471874 RepID=A0AA86YYV8_PROST|nr:hypothetical protein [Providencia stuartii]EDU59334.1 hypothetical protein PROSTU_02523 [Providencia stuartii ATCC 25827]MTC82233.1 hypothetical protein [Providencia stuartii]MTC93279.1 hypothetical protein [Providencia stuartii]